MDELTVPFVSVIIPVFNNRKQLTLCLQALQTQTYDQDRYEVIVVDNGSDPSERLDDIINHFSKAKLVLELTPSSYAARNKGLSIAEGTIIAFTDSDCIPQKDWLKNGVMHLRNTPNCGLLAGKVQLFFKNPDHLTMVELYELVTAFPQENFLKNAQFGATANVFTSRSVFDKVGRFDSSLKSGGDMEWGQRVAAFGYTQTYGSNVVVEHPARYSLTEVYQKTRRSAGGGYKLQVKNLQHQWPQRPMIRNLIMLGKLAKRFLPPIRGVATFLFDLRLKTITQKSSVIFVFLFAHYVLAVEMIKLSFGGTPSRG
jgi:glycosyltransferase involved in cell wall biosynthesis